MKGKILVVDDEPLELVSLKTKLDEEGYQVTTCADGTMALKELANSVFDVALVDIRMPKMDGLTLLKKVRHACPQLMVVMMTAYGSVESAVEAMKLGAEDYICKPFTFEEILIRLQKLMERRSRQTELQQLREEVSTKYTFHNLVGKSTKMREIFRRIEVVAKSNATVLIEGESGTGKELVATAIHYNSPRFRQPLIKVSCAMLNREILESELFGHEAGAFTGAIKARKGRFELADGGTLFLDEVDDIPVELQVKLLRALQEMKFERVGGEKEIEVDVRVVAATKQDLRGLIDKGMFREDLYYRLRVVPIHLPPLRERKEEIPYLVEHFLNKLGAEKGPSEKTVSPAAMKALIAYDWPGNVRELENAVEHAVALCGKKTIELDHLPDYVRHGCYVNIGTVGQEDVSLDQIMARVEQQIVQWALKRTAGNQSDAAKLLGIPRTTFREKLSKHGRTSE